MIWRTCPAGSLARRQRIAGYAVVLAALCCLGSAIASDSAMAVDVQRLEDRILDPQAHARITYEGTVNAASYQQDGIVTHNGWQYTAWYRNVGTGQSAAVAVVARRQLPDGAWESTLLNPPSGQTYGLFTNDSHNTIALGITPGDGRLHITFPTHDNPVRYTRTVPGVVDDPESVPWTSRLFDPVYTLFPGAAGAPTTFTYPQFENVKVDDGVETLVTWRDGSTNNGRQALLRYNNDAAGTWSFLGRFTDNAGTYNSGFGSPSTSRYGYIHGFTSDPATGRIAVGISWREQNAAWCTGPLAVGNHDLGFTYSDDAGSTWRNNAGAVVANTTTGATAGTIRPDSPGIVVVPIGINKGLINQETQNFDGQGRVHIVTSRVPDANISGNCVGDFYNERAANARPYHHWRDAAGNWTTTELPQRSGSSGRTNIVFDSNDNAYIVLPDGKIMAATPASGYTDWAVVFDDPTVSLVSEMIVDRVRVRDDNVLTVAYQVPPTALATCRGTGASADCRSEYRLASFALGQAGPHATRQSTPEAEPAPAAGWSDSPGVDIGVSAVAGQAVVPGESVSFDVDVTNHGEIDDSTGVNLTFDVPAGFSYVDEKGHKWECQDPALSVLSCEYGDGLDAGQSAPRLTVRLQAPSVIGGATVSSEVEARSDGAVDLKPANNHATVEAAVMQPAADTVAPTVTRSLSGNLQSGSYIGGAVLTVTAVDNAGGSGVKLVEYNAGTGWQIYNGPVGFLAEGFYSVQTRATDRVGNVSAIGNIGATVAAGALAPPSVAIDLDGDTDEADRFLGSVEASFSGSATPFSVAGTEYRLDGGVWNPYTAAFTIDDPGFHELEVKVTDTAGREATAFADFTVRPATCSFGFSEEFNGGALDYTKWSRHHTTPSSAVSFVSGSLVMPTAALEIDGTQGGPVHFVGRPLPAGSNWTVTTRMRVSFTGGWQFAGIMLYQSDTNLFRAGIEHNNSTPGQSFLRTVKDDPPNHTRTNGASTSASLSNPSTLLLRMTRNGNNLTAQYTFDSVSANPTWTTIPAPAGGTPVNTTPARDGADVRIGLVAGGNWSAPSAASASFDYLRLEGETPSSCPNLVAPVSEHELEPVEPDGIDGRYKHDTVPQFTLSATDDVTAEAAIRQQYRVGDDTRWSEYEGEPVSIHGPGDDIQVQYRAIDGDGNVEAPNTFAVSIAEPPEPPIGNANMSISLKPKSGKIKGKKKLKVKVTVTNNGDAAGTGTAVCVTFPKKKVKAKKCTNAGTLTPGAKKTVTITFAGKPAFKKGKAVVKFSVRTTSNDGTTSKSAGSWKVTLKR